MSTPGPCAVAGQPSFVGYRHNSWTTGKRHFRTHVRPYCSESSTLLSMQLSGDTPSSTLRMRLLAPAATWHPQLRGHPRDWLGNESMGDSGCRADLMRGDFVFARTNADSNRCRLRDKRLHLSDEYETHAAIWCAATQGRHPRELGQADDARTCELAGAVSASAHITPNQRRQ